jgi:hypothetical protein
MRRKTAAAELLLLALAFGCARRPIRGQEVSGLDRKLSTFAWIEQGDLVTLVVDTQAARDRDGARYLPLEVAIANHGMRQLRLTRESFTLLDEQGNRYPMAGPRELIEGYEQLDFDRNLAELEGIVFNKFGALARYDSSFAPTREEARIVRDLVSIPKHGFIIDWIHFPEPRTGIRGHRFELFVDSPDLPDPVFVKFEVQ